MYFESTGQSYIYTQLYFQQYMLSYKQSNICIIHINRSAYNNEMYNLLPNSNHGSHVCIR